MIICVCNRASFDACTACVKEKFLKPSRNLFAETWRRDISDIKAKLAKERLNEYETPSEVLDE